MTQVLAMLQARCSSSRLPGKVLKPLLGTPMILRQIERLQRSRHIDDLIVVTSVEASDDPLAALCLSAGVKLFRGSLHDVLDRFYQASLKFPSQHIVRATADCPLTDAGVIDAVIEMHVSGDYDYSSNVITQTFPDGLDIEIVRSPCLHEAWAQASLPSQREHVTPFFYSQPQRFRLGSYCGKQDYSGLRWTVDEAADFTFVEQVYQALYADNPAFAMVDVLTLLHRQPQLQGINMGVARNAGYLQSLLADAQTNTTD